jgi:hypothetical protein
MTELPPAAPTPRRRLLLLLGLAVAVLALLAWREFGGTVPAGPAAAASNSKTPVMPTPAAPLALPEPLELAALEPVPAAPETGRNPFRFGVPPAPPRPIGPPAPVAVPPPVAPLPSGPPPLPPIPLKAPGVEVLPGGQRVAVLKDPGSGMVFQAAEGQIVDGRYRVVKIGLESVVVSYVDGTGQRTIPFGG